MKNNKTTSGNSAWRQKRAAATSLDILLNKIKSIYKWKKLDFFEKLKTKYFYIQRTSKTSWGSKENNPLVLKKDHRYVNDSFEARKNFPRQTKSPPVRSVSSLYYSNDWLDFTKWRNNRVYYIIAHWTFIVLQDRIMIILNRWNKMLPVL